MCVDWWCCKSDKIACFGGAVREWTRLGVGMAGSGTGIRCRSLDGVVVFAPIRARRVPPAEAVTGSR